MTPRKPQRKQAEQNEVRRVIEAITARLRMDGHTFESAPDPVLAAAIRFVVKGVGHRKRVARFELTERQESRRIGTSPPKRKPGPLRAEWIPRPGPRRPRHS